jgi:CRP-like cAMP-binding protein
VREGDRPTESTLMIEGFCGRYSTFADGRRQFTALHIAGDFVDLHSFLLKPMDHGVVALSPCRIVTFPHAALREITEQFPHLTRVLWFSTLIDAAIHRAWLVSMGRRAALAHMAHLLCELLLRLHVVGLAEGRSFNFPLTQQELADILGLSMVHVNRVIQDLRAKKLVAWRSGRVSILDWEGLVALAEFDPTYLHLEPQRV